MQTVILSAGQSSRFLVDGFPHQKSMLPMPNGQVLLEWQLSRLPGDKFLYISRAEYEKRELPVIIRSKKKFPLKDVWIKKKTVGPLDGLWNMRKYLNTCEPLLITYNDELIAQETLMGFVDVCMNKDYQAGLICFDTPDPRFTRVPGIGDASAGCTYYFRSGAEFLDKVRDLPRGAHDGCPSAVYSFDKWLPFMIGKHEFVELGTADEYKLWGATQGMTRESMGF